MSRSNAEPPYLRQQREFRNGQRQYVGERMGDAPWAQTIGKRSDLWALYTKTATMSAMDKPQWRPKKVGEIQTRNKQAVRKVLDALSPFIESESL